jgi:hypothetical protein
LRWTTALVSNACNFRQSPGAHDPGIVQLIPQVLPLRYPCLQIPRETTQNSLITMGPARPIDDVRGVPALLRHGAGGNFLDFSARQP